MKGLMIGEKKAMSLTKRERFEEDKVVNERERRNVNKESVLRGEGRNATRLDRPTRWGKLTGKTLAHKKACASSMT